MKFFGLKRNDSRWNHIYIYKWRMPVMVNMWENIKTRNITWERKGLYDDEWILQEDIVILNINALFNREVKTERTKKKDGHIKEYSCRFDPPFPVTDKKKHNSIRI